ncbi:MAG: nucleotidyltransferase domain-containing protein [bacterium]
MIGSLADIEEKAVIDFKEELLKKLGTHIILIKLYGSKARENSHPDSDIDIFILMDQDDQRLIDKILDISWEIECKYKAQLLLSPVVYEQKEFNKERDFSFVVNVEREGITLWSRE